MLKRVWISEDAPYTLSMEYEDPNKLPMSYHVLKFPAEPTPKHPLRMTATLGVMTDEDLVMLHQAIHERLYGS